MDGVCHGQCVTERVCVGHGQWWVTGSVSGVCVCHGQCVTELRGVVCGWCGSLGPDK